MAEEEGPREIAPGVVLVDAGYVRPGLAASYLVRGESSAAIVETGTALSVPRILAALAARGVPRESVSHVVVTHVHLDHAGGAGALLRELPRARLVVHPRGARHLVDPSKLLAGAAEVYGGPDRLRALYGEVLPVPAGRVDEAPEDLVEELRKKGIRFATAAGELALRNAASAGIVKYLPGDPSFSVLKPEILSPPQKAGLERIAGVMRRFGGTGVQEALNQAVFSLLDLIVVYPVEDEHKYADGKGRVLPDAFLMKKGSTPRDLAFRVHTDIGQGFLHAVDARTKMRVKDTHPLKDRDIIKIVSARR